MKLKKGFTLIELLVVIAIIGILASVVLASLNSARSKGKDASATSSISSIRAQAEIFYNSNTAHPNTYTGICTAATNADSQKLADLISAANLQVPAAGLFTCASGESNTPATDSYTVNGTLNSGKTFCVDSTGYAGENGGSTFVAGQKCK